MKGYKCVIEKEQNEIRILTPKYPKNTSNYEMWLHSFDDTAFCDVMKRTQEIACIKKEEDENGNLIKSLWVVKDLTSESDYLYWRKYQLELVYSWIGYTVWNHKKDKRDVSTNYDIALTLYNDIDS